MAAPFVKPPLDLDRSPAQPDTPEYENDRFAMIMTEMALILSGERRFRCGLFIIDPDSSTQQYWYFHVVVLAPS